MNAPVRLAVLDRTTHDGWADLLRHPTTRIEGLETLTELAGFPADCVCVAVPASELVEAAGALAAQPQVSALALFVGLPGLKHPLAQLLSALGQGKREWEASFDAIQDPMAVLDAEGRIVRANRAFADALLRDVRALRGLHYLELLGSPEGPGLDPVAESLKQGRPRALETQYPLLPGVRQVTAAPLGQGGGLVAVLKDVTEHKKEQERMLQNARLADIGQLAAGVAHEINTPLASIALRAESLLKSVEDPRLAAIDSFRKFPRYLKTIEQETFRCKKIIGALLEFSSSRRRDARPVDLNALAERAADLVGHQMKLKQVALSLKLAPDLPVFRADDAQLRQVMIALLMNALDATPAGGHVEVETRRAEDGRILLAVSDDGCGIPDEARDKVFSPFFTTKATGQGTGLGLAICHGIVTAHGGEIRVESAAGHGTRMSVLLPAAAAPPG